MTLSHNSANIYLMNISIHLSGKTTLFDNIGSLVAIMSNVTFSNDVKLMAQFQSQMSF